jgi:metal-responsive CopG/Arc/MetJ family transcriptional regulator
MATVKTAISLQESLFEKVNELAEELQMPRSHLFVLAVEEFIKRHENCKLLETLNEVYDDFPDSDEQAWRDRMRQQHRQLVEGEW